MASGKRFSPLLDFASEEECVEDSSETDASLGATPAPRRARRSTEVSPRPPHSGGRGEEPTLVLDSSNAALTAGNPDGVTEAVASAVALLEHAQSSRTGLHMLSAWANDALTAHLLCCPAVLARLRHLFALRVPEAAQILSILAINQPSLLPAMLTALGPEVFVELLCGEGGSSIRADRLLESTDSMLAAETLLLQRHPAWRDFIITLLLALKDPLLGQSSHPRPVVLDRLLDCAAVLVAQQGCGMALFQGPLKSGSIPLMQAACILLCGLASHPHLPTLPPASCEGLLLTLASMLTGGRQTEEVAAYAIRALTHRRLVASLPRPVIACMVAYLETTATATHVPQPETVPALLANVLSSAVVSPTLALESVTPEAMAQCLALALGARCDRSPLVLSLCGLLAELLRLPHPAALDLAVALPMRDVFRALGECTGRTQAALAHLLQRYLARVPMAGLLLCPQLACEAWFGLFLRPGSTPQLRELAAEVLHASADHHGGLKRILDDIHSVRQVSALLRQAQEPWHQMAVWMLRFAASGSEARKNQVFLEGQIDVVRLASWLHSDSSHNMQKELAAFFKSLTSMDGERKTKIFEALPLAELSKLLRSRHACVQEHVAGLLRNLTHGDARRKQVVFQALDLEDVMRLLASPHPRVLQSTTGLLQNLCTRDEQRRELIFRQLPLDVLVHLLEDRDVRVHAPTAGLIMNLCRSSRTRKRAILAQLPMHLLTRFYENGPPPEAVADQASGLLQHMRMAFLSQSREALHAMVDI